MGVKGFLISCATSIKKNNPKGLNIGDEDAVKVIKIYSLKSREEIQALIDEHQGQEYLSSLIRFFRAHQTIVLSPIRFG